MSFYNNYLVLCNSVGKTPSAVALEIGFSKSTVSRWKSGQSANDATLQKVADYFGCSIEDLTKEKEPNAENDTELDETTKELIDLAYSLNDDDRALLLEMARSIRKRRADYK